MRRILTTLMSVALLGVVGCSSSRELLSPIAPGRAREAVDSPRVTKIVCLWEPGSGSLQSGPKRGVLGQILFFDGSGEAPIRVDGKVTVLVFDDHGTPAEQAKPVQKLILTPEELQATYIEGSLGHSYHIPVPYTRAEGLATTCTMGVKYTSPNGEATYSDLSSVYLDGKKAVPSGLSNKRTIGPVAKNPPAIGDRVAESDIRKIGNTEIVDVEAGEKSLKSLTIHQEMPARRRTLPARRQVARQRAGQPRKRFRLSGAEPAQEASTLGADDFAPLD